MRWVFLVLVAAATAYGQISAQTGAVNGYVTDPSGAVVPNAKVTIVGERGDVFAKTTGETGDYSFPLLAPGVYTLTVESKGFNKATVSDIRVQITETTTVPISLVVGAEAVEVTVVAEQSPINVANPTLGNVLPGSILDKLPLAVRNFTNLLAFNPATAATIPDASLAFRGSTTIFVNGQRATMNNLVINGIDANNLATNNFASVPVPSPDTIEEFRVQTSLYDASQGKSSGGNVNVITKSGGKEYHGQLYEFFRNEKLNANDFFFNRLGTPRAQIRQNQFGGSFGGPVPKLANTFFFASYEGTRQRNGLSNSVSARAPVLPDQRTAENLAAAFGLNASQIHPVALALLNQKGQYDGWLVPSGKGSPLGQLGFIAFSSPQIFDEDQFNTNGDHIFSDRHRLAIRYFQAIGTATDPFGGIGARQLGNGASGPFNNYLASITETWTVSPFAINEFRLGFNRVESGVTPNEPVSLSDIGMRRFNSSVFPGIPQFTVLGMPSFGGPSSANDSATTANTIHLSDVIALSRGAHTVRLGFEMRNYQVNTYNNFNSRGFIGFSTFATFLRGGPIAQTTVGSGQTARDFRARDVSWFVQDDWRIARRLTLNLGLRYDYFGASTDRRNRIGNFDPSLLDAETLAQGGPGLLKGFVLPEEADFGSIKGTPGVSRSTLTDRNLTNFAPRIGVAWDVFGNGRTAIRSGYGIYYARTSNQTLLQSITSAPFFQNSTLPQPGTDLADPFPTLPLPQQFPIFPVTPLLTGFDAQGAPTFTPGTLLSVNPIQRNLRTPYAQHYNFSISQQMPWGFAMETGYVGSQGVRLPQGLNLNQARLANAAAPIRGLTANSALNRTARVGVPGFSTTGLLATTDNGHSSYNAFFLTATRRSGRLFLQAAYTFAKSIDNGSGNTATAQDLAPTIGNNLVPALQRGLSDFDRRHRLQITYNYDVPGIGSGFVRHITGNWSFGGTTFFQSGTPITFLCASCFASNVYGLGTAQGGLLSPELIGDFSNLRKSGDPREFIDVSGFNTGILGATPIYRNGETFGGNLNAEGGPGDQTYTVGSTAGTNHTAQLFGTLPRNPGIRGPFQQQWDFYLARQFRLTERFSLTFRSEFFNLFNHAFFNNPDSIVGSPSFGQYSTQANAPRMIQFALKLQF